MSPRIASAAVKGLGNVEAAEQLITSLQSDLGVEPHLVLVYGAAGYCPEILRETFAAWAPQAAIAGASSCLGVMTEAGFAAPSGLGALAIHDPEGAFGVGTAELKDTPREAGRAAIQAAVQDAGRTGQVPNLIWISAAPGEEEAVLLGVEDLVGGVPVLGGSSADDDVTGDWWQLHTRGTSTASVVVVAMFYSQAVGWSFHSGYSPTSSRGTVTRSEGRRLYEIDGAPAADVYDRWAGGILGEARTEGGPILSQTTWHPLGRQVGSIGTVPYHVLLHPERVLPGGGLQLFSAVVEGESLTLMSGQKTTLLARAGRVARYAMESVAEPELKVTGALVVFCAGCMLAVQDDMEAVLSGLRCQLGDVPLLGVFTFGEQGCLFGGENRHGNLMISVVTFLGARD